MTKSLIMLTSGEYSDYTIHGVILCPGHEWLDERIAQWKADHPQTWGQSNETRKWYPTSRTRGDFKAFTAWLLTQPDCEEADYNETWLGAYHQFSDEQGLIHGLDAPPVGP